MKKVAGFVFFLSFLFIASMANAHSGRTDSSGGHNCSEKSIAKGLCTGYHYHNGGGGTSSGGSNSAPATSTDKNCTDFATYDEVIEYWNAKGYSATYDPENLDGFGNGVVDDGIPCEAPSGYDRTKINNSPEQAQFKQDQQDSVNGETAGYEQGMKDGLQENSQNSSTNGTAAYQNGYTTGYKKGYQEGKKQIDGEKTKTFDEGYALGQQQDTITIPDKYNTNPILKKSFEEGFNKAIAERVQEKKEELAEIGYKDGREDEYSPPKDFEDIYVNAYKSGFDKAQLELKNEYFQQGYEAAFKKIEYENPNLQNEKFEKWFKEGFESNKVVNEIAEVAFSHGKEGNALDIPSNYKEGEVIFKHYYEVGYKEYENEVDETQKTAAGGIGVAAIVWLGRRMYVAKKMIS